MECFQNISLVPSDSYLVVKDALNVPSLIDEVGHALRRPEQPSLDPIEPDDPSLGISNQGKRQTVLLLESPMALYGVRAHPYDNGVLAFDGFMVLTEATGLRRSAAGEVLGIEIENNQLFPGPI